MITADIAKEDMKDILARANEPTIPHEVMKAYITMKVYIQEAQNKTHA